MENQGKERDSNRTIILDVLFVIVQYKGPIKTKKILMDNIETLDSLQDLA